MIVFDKPIIFQWDKGNREKNWDKHRVTNRECEEAFFDNNKKIYPDPRHSEQEMRKIVIGKTKTGKLLFIVFTIRKNRIRIISARKLNKRREVDLYEKAA